MFNALIAKASSSQLQVADLQEWAKSADLSYFALLQQQKPQMANPGIAGLLAFTALLDFFSEQQQKPVDEVIQFLLMIREESAQALEMLRSQGVQANIKPLINKMFKYHVQTDTYKIEDANSERLLDFLAQYQEEAYGELVFDKANGGRSYLVINPQIAQQIEKYLQYYRTSSATYPFFYRADIALHATVVVPANEASFDIEKAALIAQQYQGQKIPLRFTELYRVAPETDSRIAYAVCLELQSSFPNEYRAAIGLGHLQERFHVTLSITRREKNPQIVSLSSVGEGAGKQSELLSCLGDIEVKMVASLEQPSF